MIYQSADFFQTEYSLFKILRSQMSLLFVCLLIIRFCRNLVLVEFGLKKKTYGLPCPRRTFAGQMSKIYALMEIRVKAQSCQGEKISIDWQIL